VKDIQNVVQQNPELGYTLITGIHGGQQFDKLTRTKTVESILSKMDSDGIMKYIQSLLEQIDESGEYVLFRSLPEVFLNESTETLLRKKQREFGPQISSLPSFAMAPFQNVKTGFSSF
jgi:DNA polymerase phi